MRNNRVVITGFGVYSALGKNINEFWTNAINGKSGITEIDINGLHPISFKYGAQIKEFNSEEYFERKDILLYDLFTQYSIIAADEAVKNANFLFNSFAKNEVGVILGTSIGGQTTHDEAFKSMYLNNSTRGNPLTIPRLMPNAATSAICMKYGLMGPSYTISTACASSNHAISNAFQLIKNGTCKAMITGGSETPFSFGFLKAWEALRVVSNGYCKPFDKNRQGMILGEGAGILILENLESALERGATIYGEIVGIGMSSDASHMTKPNAEGVKLAIESALKDAGISPNQVDHINAHGTGTEINDAMESQVIEEIFGNRLEDVPVTASKSLHGHALGATGAFEAMLTTLSVFNSIIPPTAHTEELGIDMNINLVIKEPLTKNISHAISNNFAFGGLNSVIVFKKY